MIVHLPNCTHVLRTVYYYYEKDNQIDWEGKASYGA